MVVSRSVNGPDAVGGQSSLTISRAGASGRGGVVSGKMAGAVRAGAEMLASGGNAIDAAVTTAFAIGVAEPWMNGLGGGGFLVAWLARERRAIAIEYPMISPSGATPSMYRLAGGAIDTGLFGWPATVGNTNTVGHLAVAVPGTVAGLALALERHGTRSLADVLTPAIALAEEGIPVTWHTTLTVARDLANLARFPATRAIFLDATGNPPVTIEQARPTMIRQPELARTLRAIADEGARSFYEGETADRIVRHLAEHGSSMTRDDFARYEATESPTTDALFAGHTVHTIGKGTGGTSLAQSLMMMERLDLASCDHNSAETIHRLTAVFRRVFADRFAYLADPEAVEVPIDGLLDPAYIASRVAGIDLNRANLPEAGDRASLGVRHALAASVPEYLHDGSTTHLGVIDREGNGVSLTQTLLSLWGSRVVAPETGVLLNNGMMWFDPEPGHPNSVAGGKRPLSNMTPALVSRDGELAVSIGSSGGRKIMNCNAQVIANLTAHGMTLHEAIEAPRIDASTRDLAISMRIDPAVRQRLEEMGHPVSARDETLLTADFASPVGCARDGSGGLEGAVDQWYFPATTIALD